MIGAYDLTKRFDGIVAVENVSFEVQPGEVVGLVGHDGAGKTTTLRMLVGHVVPTSGSAAILGRSVQGLKQPAARVGVQIGLGLDPGRTAASHLRICAVQAGVRSPPIDELLRLVGLERERDRRARHLSAGMRRRLSIAAALVADPEVLILDEPDAGLDAEGVRWLQALLRRFADSGRTVLVACRASDELEAIADQVLVMDRGSLLAQAAPDALTGERVEVLVRSPGAEVLAEELRGAGIAPFAVSPDELRVRDVPPRVVAQLANSAAVPVWEIREEQPSLDEIVVDLTRSDGDGDGDGDGRANGDGARGEDGHTAAGPAQPERDDAARDERDNAEDALDEALRALPAPAGCDVVAVVSPAGGLGRTTLAYLVADVLAGCAGADVLAVALSCDHERMSIPVADDGRTTLHLGDLLNDLPQFDELAHISPYVSVAGSGAHVLGGPPQPQDLAAVEPEQLELLLDFAARFYALVVLDVGDLSEPALRAVVRRADRVLLLGAPGAVEVEDLSEGSLVLDVIEAERSDRATLVFNRVDAEQASAFAQDDGDGAASYVLVPRDHELIRALDAGDFDLAAVRAPVRVALKRLALAAAGGAP